MTDAPAVSVVVAAYDAANTLGDCLRSLRALAYPKDRLEILVVDNASRDDTAAVARGFAPEVAVLTEARRGAAAARNRGIAAARGDVVAFTDADCVVERDWLAELVPALGDPTVGVVGGRILARRPCNRIAAFGEDLHDHAAAMASVPPYAITMNWVSPKRVLDEVGRFDEAFLRCQDVDLAYRIVQAGYRLAYAERAVVRHRNRSTLRGLWREARLHGQGAVAIRSVHAAYLAQFPSAPSYARRIGGRLRRLRDLRRLDRGVLSLVFELGKIRGERSARP